MQILSRLVRRLRTAVVFYRELNRYGVDYRRLPKQFQLQLAAAIRDLARDDPRAETEYTRIAALAVAGAVSAQFAALSKCFSEPDRWRRVKPLALIVVPLLDLHRIPHEFTWPDQDPQRPPLQEPADTRGERSATAGVTLPP